MPRIATVRASEPEIKSLAGSFKRFEELRTSRWTTTSFAAPLPSARRAGDAGIPRSAEQAALAELREEIAAVAARLDLLTARIDAIERRLPPQAEAEASTPPDISALIG